MSSNKRWTQSHKSNESSIGAKSNSSGQTLRSPSKPTKSTKELDQKPESSTTPKVFVSSNTHNYSQIPRYLGSRERRHSDNGRETNPRALHNCCDLNEGNGSCIRNICSIHGIRSPNDMLLYEMLKDMDLKPNECQIPNEIRVLHENHICNNVRKSRSVPNSKINSVLTTPLSTPSTPVDSRRMSFNRSSLSQISTPLRQSKSSLSVTSQTTRHTNQKTFAEYMPLCEVQKGLRKGEIVEGVLRINPRNYTDAYISAPEGGIDIYVGGMIDRNRALNGDRVAVKINEVKHWKILSDIIRINWDEWKHYFESLIHCNHMPTEKEETPNICTDSSSNALSPIDESDERSERIKTINSNEINSEETDEQSISDKLCDDPNNETHKIDKIGEEVSPLNDLQTNKKKKRKRSRKKKSESIPKQKESDVQNNESEKPSLLKTEIIEGLHIKDVKTFSKSGVSDELHQKIQKIQSLKIEKLLEITFWKSFVQKTGKVVAISEALHSRKAGGRLTHMKEKNQNWALFIPNDSRIPRLRISMKDCPPDFFHHSEHFAQSLFIAKLVEWKTTDTFPSATLIKQLGDIGDINAESELLLMEHNIDFIDFPDAAYYGLPDIENDEWSTDDHWSIPSEELQRRRDFRNECVFTIDPSTARDLDDALSIKPLDENHFEVGVHIADVTYFLKEDMPLDEIARSRATSVYLVQKVIPMLPRILCERLCSLNAGEEKLTFSVVWKIDRNGNIVEEWFGRTVIKSCIKLSYELAQDMIDDPNKKWKEYELPQIYGKWKYTDISQSVNLLNNIAINLRKYRFERGALKIDKLKLQFVLDKESGLPVAFSPYVYRDSNRLIEEFMLLANMAVAHKIYNTFEDKAFLRCHPPPSEDALKDFITFCKYNGFEVDTTSSLTLQKSLEVLVNDDLNISRVVAHYLLKSMQTAQYICVGMQSEFSSLHHYALNVPLYTHFTSPIRRYADVIVHRLLASALSYRKDIGDSVQDLYRLAQRCNDKKLSSRLVSEGSAKLFLYSFIKQIAKMNTKAIVIQVYDHSFDVLILSCDHICRVYLDQLSLKQFIFETKRGKNQLIIEWNDPKNKEKTVQQTISSCLIVNVQISVNDDDSSKLNAILQHPNGIFYRKDITSNTFIES